MTPEKLKALKDEAEKKYPCNLNLILERPKIIYLLQEAYIAGRTDEAEKNESNAAGFMTWAFTQDEYTWTGESWDENTGHDDFESLTHAELYQEYINSK